MDILAYILILTVGISLGLIGSGGSILAVPILVYLFGIDKVLATSYSLIIVGMTSLIGSYSYYKQDLIDLKKTIMFAIPAILGTVLVRTFIVHHLPEYIIQTDHFSMTSGMMIMVIFAILMFFSAFAMIKGRKNLESKETTKSSGTLMIIFEGLAVGGLTGLVGAGGGFLIIPALVIFMNMPMKNAVGTSLLIIALKSLIGFISDIGTLNIDYMFIGLLSLISIFGIFIGVKLSHHIDNKKLKPLFGYFIIVMAIYIIIKELFF